MTDRIYLTSGTCDSKSQDIVLSHIDTEKRWKPGPTSYVSFDNGGEFIVSANVFRSVRLGKSYSIWLEEIGPELADGVSPALIAV